MKTSKSLKTFKEIEKDCIKLKRQGYLTDYGEGQLDLIKIINNNKKI